MAPLHYLSESRGDVITTRRTRSTNQVHLPETKRKKRRIETLVLPQHTLFNC